jgi:glycosyltransferase involved in cell wall biosynthesis
MATIEVVVPVYNEQEALPRSIPVLHKFLTERIPQPWIITIADNGSTDNTIAVATALSQQYPGVRVVRIDQKGRGWSLQKTWLESQADIICYTDVDLSTDLEAFPRLVGALEQEGYDVATGSRLMPGAQVKRSFKREFVSRIYNLMVRLMFFSSFHDAQCGFKAIRREVAQDLVPLVENRNWFFDTELLLLALRKGYRIKEIPVKWYEDPGSTVHVTKTAVEYIEGLLRMRFRRLPRGSSKNKQ